MRKSKKKAKLFNKEYDDYFKKMLERQLEKLITDVKFSMNGDKYVIN